MTKRMLIDANHPEETRVVILDGSKVEEFDFEAASKRPLKGNIYLAKVTRVEPSLQAAFVEYGGNRQGFLAFAEIHPDYYQIPMADRQALLAEQEAEARRRQEDDIESFEITGSQDRGRRKPRPRRRPRKRPTPARKWWRWRRWCRWTPPPTAKTKTTAPRPESAEDEHEDVFVNHGGAVVEHDHEDEPPETKPEAAAEALPDYQGDAQVAAAEAVEENEGEIQPVSVDGETPEDMAAEAAEENEGAILPGEPRGRSRAQRRRPGAAGPAPAAEMGAQEALQDSGSDQAPPDHPGAGGQGRTRQQGRRAHHLSVAGRPLLRADAQHPARRRHLAQDHQCRRQEAPEGGGPGAGTARRHGPDHPHRRRKPHQARDPARL